MFVNPVLLALVSTAFFDIAIGASTSGRKTLDLMPRELSTSLAPRNGFASSGSSSYEAHEIVSQWSSLPAAFSQCHSVFQQRAEAAVALQAVQTLLANIQSVAYQYGSCSCGQMSYQNSYTAKFKQIISTVFNSWHSILVTGQALYSAQWESTFKCIFKKFAPFVSTAKGLCGSFRLDFPDILSGLKINMNLFVGIGINLKFAFDSLGGASGGPVDEYGLVSGGVSGDVSGAVSGGVSSGPSGGASGGVGGAASGFVGGGASGAISGGGSGGVSGGVSGDAGGGIGAGIGGGIGAGASGGASGGVSGGASGFVGGGFSGASSGGISGGVNGGVSGGASGYAGGGMSGGISGGASGGVSSMASGGVSSMASGGVSSMASGGVSGGVYGGVYGGAGGGFSGDM